MAPVGLSGGRSTERGGSGEACTRQQQHLPCVYGLPPLNKGATPRVGAWCVAIARLGFQRVAVSPQYCTTGRRIRLVLVLATWREEKHAPSG
jgi:hypothetical protein